MEVNILGSLWTIKVESEDENELLKDCDGYCDWTTKEIVIIDMLNGSLGNMSSHFRKVLRHEIVHAFLFESGLAECSGEVSCWAKNETMVDWFAWQGLKIYKAWQDANAI